MPNAHDDALLNDLLDERLTPAEEAALSARLEREPALREAWDDLVRAREVVLSGSDPEPPADFVARVRVRIDASGEDAEPLEDDETPVPGELDGATESAPDTATSATGASLPHALPRGWRRLMLVAYAAAAALVLGIGLFALSDRDRPGAPAAAHETSLAKADRESSTREDAFRSEPSSSADPSPEARALEDRLAEAERNDPGNRVPPPAVEAARPWGDGGRRALPAEGSRGGVVPPAGGPAAPAPTSGFAGPSGSVAPGLRAPTGAPPPPPPGPAPEPAEEPRPRFEGKTAADDKPRKDEDAAKAARTPPRPADVAAPAGEILVLEAPSVEVGKTLLGSITAGPTAGRARAAGEEAGGKPPASTRVSLRRFDPRRDAALLGALQRLDAVGSGGAAGSSPKPGAPSVPAAPAPSAAPPVPTPPPPATPPATPPTTPAPMPAAPAAPTGAPARPATVLGLEALSLTPDEYARLQALLGPASPDAPRAGDALEKKAEDAKNDEGAPQEKSQPAAEMRRVRVLIVTPAR